MNDKTEGRSNTMPVELSIASLEDGVPLTERIDEVRGMLHAQGLTYRSTSDGLCIEDEWDNVMAFIHQLNALRSRPIEKQSPLVFTLRVPLYRCADG
jgi:uncharacterized protein YqgV (UPF0045/DUF77 family)